MGAGCGYLAPNALRGFQKRSLQHRCALTRSIILSYDDGPGTNLTPQILDLLASASAKSSFFLLGMRVAGNEGVIARVIADGHEVGCHGQQHIHGLKSWPWKVTADVNAGYRTLSPWIGEDAPFRPPYGKLSLATWLVIHRHRASIGWWTIDSGDTHLILPDPQTVADRVARLGGGVVLLHDFDRSTERQRFVLRTTELILRAAKQEGLLARRLCDLPQISKKSPVQG